MTGRQSVVLIETTQPEKYPGMHVVTADEPTARALERLGYDPATATVLRFNFGD